MGGKAKPKKHTAAELAAKAKAATESVGGGKAGIEERDKKAGLKIECLEPGCQGVKLASLTVCKTHWSNKHCTCRRADCECFPADKYEPLYAKPTEAVKTHHNQVRIPAPSVIALTQFEAVSASAFDRSMPRYLLRHLAPHAACHQLLLLHRSMCPSLHTIIHTHLEHPFQVSTTLSFVSPMSALP